MSRGGITVHGCGWIKSQEAHHFISCAKVVTLFRMIKLKLRIVIIYNGGEWREHHGENINDVRKPNW